MEAFAAEPVLLQTPGLMDREAFVAAEVVIERGHQTFIEVGHALLSIRDGRGYRHAGYSSFETYVRDRWGWARRHGYRLIDAAQLADELATVSPGTQLPTEQHARAILNVPPADRLTLVRELGDLSAYSTRQLRAEIQQRRSQRVRDSRVQLLASAPAAPPRADCWIGVAEASSLPAAYDDTDLFVTSPPYGLGLEGSDADVSLDWGGYLDSARAWAAELYAKAHPRHGRLCLNVPLDRTRGSREPVYADWLEVLRSVGWRYESTIVWKEGNVSNHQARGSVGSANAPHAVAPVEMVLVMYRGQWDRGEPKRASDIRELDWIDWLSTTWSFAGEHRYRVGHAAPFPEELPRRCIQLFSFPGDLVADPFLGSGTTAVTALQLGRRFCGSDVDPECVELARARVAREVE